MCEKTDSPPTGPQLLHAIKRNFGGLEESGLEAENIFKNKLRGDMDTPPDMSTVRHAVSSMFTHPMKIFIHLTNRCVI